ncbi:hypothetical protein RF679_17685 [Undibacterium cyanobacteriorum]|uniref:Uncharacterized protein n=1 Tax=Undibacterium cyanobacteriorum TaxID=3073561 RepID=A0ABY9RIF1_9BURK|nr:hypothetical protein [Undibacterium sp. 20NA77.5]WMW80454.1 hypothetical protein RF679_17685 [Undibacterium sp. 20NA77.5]
MKIYAKIGLGLICFGFFLSVLGAIAIRTHAPIIEANQKKAAALDTTQAVKQETQAASAPATPVATQSSASVAAQNSSVKKP